MIVVIEITAMNATRTIARDQDDAVGSVNANPSDTAAAITIGAKVIDHLSDFDASARPAHPSAKAGSLPVPVGRSFIAIPLVKTVFRHREQVA
ncbi:MAG: hypothetical protein ABI658_24270 [Acidimicrobiales bacterium]